MRQIQCTEVWGGTQASDVSVLLAGIRGECYALPYAGHKEGGDIHFLSVCGISILSKVVLADVSGHGVESAEVARIIHTALVENIDAHDNSSMLEQVNAAFLQRRTGDFRFTTMASLIFDSRDRSLVYAYAGHPSILRGNRETRRFSPLTPDRGERGGIPLGVLPGSRYVQHAVQLIPGDVLVLYTDAFSEARDGDGGMLGEEGLARILEGAPSLDPPALKRHLLDAVGTDLNDDATLIILEMIE
jgi:sigma-B regulation protein RsbU (phosphoserine phosphatase)